MGWVSIDRKITEHWVWNDKPFSKGQAWIDMVMMANHKDNTFPLGGKLITVERGSFITSELKLMDRWEWSKSKVRYFLKSLEIDHMIIKKTDRKKTTITIVNYDVYQNFETTEKPKKNRKKTMDRPIKDTNNKDNNITILSKDNKTYSDNPDLNKAILEFIEFRKKIKSPMTDRAIELLINNLKKLSTNPLTQIAILNQSILHGWKGVFPLKDEKQSDKPKITNKFNQFPQREYSQEQMSEINRKLLNKALGGKS